MGYKFPFGKEPWPTRGRRPDPAKAPPKYVPPLAIELRPELEPTLGRPGQRNEAPVEQRIPGQR